MVWIDGIRQICVVTSDLEAVVAEFADRLGIGPWKVWRFESPRLFRMKIDGRAAEYAMELALAYCGAMQMEVIRPIAGDTVYGRFMSREPRGGVQHAMISSRERFAASMRRLADAGYSEVQSALVNTATTIGPVAIPRVPNALVGRFATRFAFVGGRGELGTTLEVAAYPPGVSPDLGWKLGKADRSIEASRRPLLAAVDGLAIACSDVGVAAKAWERAGFRRFVRSGSLARPDDADQGEESWMSAGSPGSVEIVGPTEPAVGAPSHPRVAWVSAVAASSLEQATTELTTAGARELARFAHPLAGPTVLFRHRAFGSTPIAVRARR